MRPLTEADNVFCARCGGADRRLVIGPQRECRCDALFGRQERSLAALDPEERMTFERVSKPDESLVAVLGAGREIAFGRRRRGLILFGKPGTGKTHAAVATVRQALGGRGRLLAGYFHVSGLLSRVRATYADDAHETREGVVEEVALHEIAVLDDLGKEHRSPDAESIVYEVVDALYRSRRTMIVCSNLPGPEFVSRYDDAVRSRLLGTCEKFVVRGEDRRLAEWGW